ncbi:hypothetical protein [Streptomyces sp. NBC_01443]|nr:hypothetical protein [Streptomyces sp. NBC_01443]MCX4633474.1 hypothetical protein [Streptomyces sp. NBC_01443]
MYSECDWLAAVAWLLANARIECSKSVPAGLAGWAARMDARFQLDDR